MWKQERLCGNRINLSKYLKKENLTFKEKMQFKRERKILEHQINKLKHQISKIDIILIANSPSGLNW